MKRHPWSILLVLALLFAIFWLVNTSRAATETPEYRVIRTDKKFEIRDYPALDVATTPMKDDQMNGGFGELFRFITGRNEGSEKIAMTAPVLIETAPEQKRMSFIMPSEAVAKGLPKPAGDNVTLGKMEASRFAVLRFEGARTAENEKVAIAQLEAWLEAAKLTKTGAPILAYYDPPWTPVFLRRNEVLIPIAKVP